MSLNTRGVWTTFREIEFLEGLGKHRPVKDRPRDWWSRGKLLRKYRATMHKRVDWGVIDPYEVVAYIAQELAEEAQL